MKILGHRFDHRRHAQSQAQHSDQGGDREPSRLEVHRMKRAITTLMRTGSATVVEASVSSPMADMGILTDRPGGVRHELRSSGREPARQHRLHESQVGT